MNYYGSENNRGYRYIIVVVSNFSKIGWTIPLMNKYAQAMTDAFLQIVKKSKRKPALLETDDANEYINKLFNKFFNKKKH